MPNELTLHTVSQTKESSGLGITANQTPIEIALGIDEDGRTTARKLYKFLELNPSNFSRWCKKNISNNEFAEENVDYLRLVFYDETPTGGKVKREDFRLSATFAKKLAMIAGGPKGEAILNYFARAEKTYNKAQNEMKIFENAEFGEIRTINIDGEPWFAGNDVSRALGYAKPKGAIQNHVDSEDKQVAPIQGPSGTIDMMVINESGLYSLIFSSKLESAKRFKHWVTSEVLPSIRKTGSFAVATQNRPEIDQLKVQLFDLNATNAELLKRLENLEQRQAAVEQKTDTGFTAQERAAMAECFTALGKILSGANKASTVKKMCRKPIGIPDMPISNKQLDKIRAAMSECVRRQIAMLDGDYEGNRSAEQILRGDLYKAIRNGIGVKHTEARQSQYEEIMRIIDGYWADQKLKDRIYRSVNPQRE